MYSVLHMVNYFFSFKGDIFPPLEAIQSEMI